MKNNTLIACDPSVKKPAFSLWLKTDDRWRLMRWWKVPLKVALGGNCYKSRIRHLSLQCDYFAIETQYVGLNRRGALSLAAARGRLVQQAQELGTEIIEVNPAQWQSLLRLPPRSKRETIKKVTLWKVNTHILPEQGFLGQVTDRDIADAIMIGYYTIFQKLEKKW